MSPQHVIYRLKADLPFQVEANKCYPVYDDEFGLVGSLSLDTTGASGRTFVGFVELTPVMFGVFVFEEGFYVTPVGLDRHGVVRGGFVLGEAKIDENSARAENTSVTLED